MTAAKTIEKFTAMVGITDGIADDPEALALVERELLEYGWRRQVERCGGTPTADAPTLVREDNLAYGSLLVDEDGNPVLDEDGDPLFDAVRFYLVVVGRATR